MYYNYDKRIIFISLTIIICEHNPLFSSCYQARSASTEQRPTGSSDLAEAYHRSAERKATISQCDQICNSRPDRPNGVKYRVFSSTMYNTNALWQVGRLYYYNYSVIDDNCIL